MARLFLLGSGQNKGSDLLDLLFAHLIRNGHLLYIPIAEQLNRTGYSLEYKRLQGIFHPLGVKSITMWDSIFSKSHSDLQPFNGTYIGGGNTFKLLHDIQDSNFASLLSRFLSQDGIIYGASAGAIILGKSIRTASHLDDNNIKQTNMDGFNLLHGYSVWPHYHHTEDAQIYSYTHHHHEPVIAISERTGLFVDGDLAIVIGHEPVYVFTSHGKRTYSPSSVVSF
ncbi:Type 1 glutamine amidotransferase-like domain-containing protein [Ktedonobacteria bacterium brp13]|nr:Type 1 glutamine amidotransferase-like domain-containing protein [Ktedonobacteria bacterium brp13]